MLDTILVTLLANAGIIIVAGSTSLAFYQYLTHRPACPPHLFKLMREEDRPTKLQRRNDL